MAVCFGYALDHDEPEHDLARVYQLAAPCLDVKQEGFRQMFGYCLGIVHMKRGKR